MNKQIRIENIGEGIEEIFILSLNIKEGQKVKRGYVIGEAETYKAVFDIESDYIGVITSIFIEPGKMYPLPLVICEIDTLDSSVTKEPADVKISPRARRIIKNENLDIDKLKNKIKKDIIEELDVKNYIVNFVKIKQNRPETTFGILNDKFYNELLEDFKNERKFLKLSSSEKIEKLREAGAVIGDKVEFGYGSGLIAKYINIGAGVKFGRKTILLGEKINLDANIIFEEKSFWKCREIHVEKFTYISGETRVGWGGEWNPDALIKIGSFSHIGEQVMINPSRPVYINNNVSIGAGSKIYTHQFWQSVLDGYVALHEPVTISSNVQVGANAVILPGSKIGKGLTVGANSLIAGRYKGPGLLQGNPARIVQKGSYPRKMDRTAKQNKIIEILNDFSERYDLKLIDNYIWEGEHIRLLFQTEQKNLTNKRIIEIGFIPKQIEFQNTFFNLCSFEITGVQDKYSDVLREFFRKYGIKFKGDWRYNFTELRL